MELHQIEAYLDSPNSQERIKAIAELRYYTPEVVVPLLRRRMSDKEFMIKLTVQGIQSFGNANDSFLCVHSGYSKGK